MLSKRKIKGQTLNTSLGKGFWIPPIGNLIGKTLPDTRRFFFSIEAISFTVGWRIATLRENFWNRQEFTILVTIRWKLKPMSDLNKIVYPNLDLFLYDLREGLGQDPEIIDHNRERFWQRIYGHPEGDESDLILEPTLLAKLKQAERSESRLVELLGADVVKNFERPLEGYYYPIQIGNTYALQVNCSGVYADGIRQSNHSPQPITNIKNIQREILAHINHQPGAIGQTWILWGQLCDRDQDPTQIALECYKQLVSQPDWSRDFQAQGKVLGGTLFEFWRPPANWSEPEAIKHNHHLLIWLFPKKPSLDSIIDTITGIYIDLIYLLYYRNKILWAYGEINTPLAELKADLV
ncbi:MAG: hypothetical protein F6K52_29780 [Moorea sp. SIO3H5]|nr:hypothetical protein [Moorena sp. SIO3H5]